MKKKGRILAALREMTLKICPEAGEEIKYGGVVFSAGGDLISGIFLRKKHISLEFSYGMDLPDPEGFLEGSGKYRRHLKLMSEKDIIGKACGVFYHASFRTAANQRRVKNIKRAIRKTCRM